jgi:hypothetical protein
VRPDDLQLGRSLADRGHLKPLVDGIDVVDGVDDVPGPPGGEVPFLVEKVAEDLNAQLGGGVSWVGGQEIGEPGPRGVGAATLGGRESRQR